jgi:hypothetical protein
MIPSSSPTTPRLHSCQRDRSHGSENGLWCGPPRFTGEIPAPHPPFSRRAVPVYPRFGPVNRPNARIPFFFFFVLCLDFVSFQITNVYRMGEGRPFSALSPCSEKGETLLVRAICPENAGWVRNHFFSTVLTRVEQFVVPSSYLPTLPSAYVLHLVPSPFILLNSWLQVKPPRLSSKPTEC